MVTAVHEFGHGQRIQVYSCSFIPTAPAALQAAATAAATTRAGAVENTSSAAARTGKQETSGGQCDVHITTKHYHCCIHQQ